MRLGPWCPKCPSLLLVLLVAVPATAQVISVEGNYFFGNGAVTDLTCNDVCSTGTSWCSTDLSPFNVSGVNPQLNPLYTELIDPQFDLQPTSPALRQNGANLVDAAECCDDFFETPQFAGAVPPKGFSAGMDANEDWTTGWTFYGIEEPPEYEPGRPEVMVTANITSDETWTNDNTYILVGRIAVQPGVTLTLEAGAVVLGEASILSYLVVERDGNLQVLGTKANPVILDAQSFAPGGWGGVVIHGKAVANCGLENVPEPDGCALTSDGFDCESEGGAGFFGGSDDADNSGILRYARIGNSGRVIVTDNELNCWTFNAVGSGTTIKYLQAHFGTDDLFEWFGGTAEARYLVGTYGGDDGLDWQMGWRGKVQYALIKSLDFLDNDKGIEADNNENDFNCPGRSNPCLSNLTLIGGLQGSDGVNLRRGTNGKVLNSIIVDWPALGLDIDNNADTLPTGCLTNCNAALATATPPGASAVSFAVSVSPNPVSTRSAFGFVLSQESAVQIRVFDSAGRLVDTVYDGLLGTGAHRVTWNKPQSVSTGVYYFKATAGNSETSGKVLVLN